MNLSLTIPQLFYDLIARVLPGFLFLFSLRTCLAGTGIDPDAIVTFQSEGSVAKALAGLGFLTLCYFAGWFLCGLRWPDLQPKEDDEFRTMYQCVRLQHPESGFRIVKLRAEARLFQASRTAMFIAAGVTIAAWALRNTETVAARSIPHSTWILRVVIPLLVGIVFLMRERRAWKAYKRNVTELYSLIIDQGYPKPTVTPQVGAAQQGDAADTAVPRR